MANSRHAAQMQLVQVDEPTATTVQARHTTLPPQGAAGAPTTPDPATSVTDPDGLGPDDTARRPVDGRRRRVLVTWGAVVGVVVLAVAVLTSVDEMRREHAYERAVAVPGLLTPLDGPVHVAWRAPASSGEGTVVVADDVVVVVQRDAQGASLAAYGALTGDQRWTTRVSGPAPATEQVSLQCPSWRGARVSGLVLCAMDRAVPVYGDTAPGEPVADDALGLRVMALDAATGRMVGSWLQEGDVAGFGRVGDDMVVAVTDAEGHSVVERRSGRTGEVRWRYQSYDRLAGTLAIERATMVVSDAVAVVRGAELAVLRVGDGEPVVTQTRGQAVALVPFRDGFAAWTPAHGGWTFDREGSALTPLPAVPSTLAVDDESAQDVVVLSTGVAVKGFAAGTGDELWSVSTRSSPRAVVDGTVLVSDDGRWAGYDARTGSALWSHELDAPDWPVLTDGTLVLTPVSERGGGTTLVARGLRDGAQRWQVDVPPQVTRLAPVGGVLVGRTEDGIVVLTP